MGDKARRAVPHLTINGRDVTKQINVYLESITYTDVAEGSSDTLDINLHNVTEVWLNGWYPTKGSKIKGNISFEDWDMAYGNKWKYQIGACVLDEMTFSGNPMTVQLGALAVPANSSFRTFDRTKTWENVTIQQIGSTIASRYGLGFTYDAGGVTIKSIEQTEEPDCSFLTSLCDTYGLSIKIYNNKIVIYDMARMEAKPAVVELNRQYFIDNQWEYRDALEGTYTGVRVSYKQPDESNKDKNEISIYLGLKGETDPGSRVLRMNETCDSEADARKKGAAQVNKANRETTTFTGTIIAHKKICAGKTILLKGFGRADGKYFIDTCTLSVSDSGSTQQIEMHKVQPVLPA